MSEPLEDSDIENDPVDDRVRAIDFDALDDDDDDDGEDDDDDLEDVIEDEEVEGEDDENEEMRARRTLP